MRYTMTIPHDLYKLMGSHLFFENCVEQAGYLLCRTSRTFREVRLLAKEFIPVSKEQLLYQAKDGMCIPSSSYLPVLKKAADANLCFYLVHSHPTGYPLHSKADDETEPGLFKAAYTRIEVGVHGSLVFSSATNMVGRVWLDDDGELQTAPISLFRIVGQEYKFLFGGTCQMPDIPTFFNRQVLAFGDDLQKLLAQLHIGVVGCGGTGSAIIEQLSRLGIGEVTLIDHDRLSDTNITRVHGSGISDIGRYKVEVMRKMIDDIGLGTKVNTVADKVVFRSVAEALRDCDLIFGCTDDHAGRAVLNNLSRHYLIPFFDMGVMINSVNGEIRNIPARINIVSPGYPCLLCLNRISGARVAAELMPQDVYEERMREGYAPELNNPDPSVIAFTTAVAAQAVIEMLNFLTGYMGSEAKVYQVMQYLDHRRISISSDLPNDMKHCRCGDIQKWGDGDVEPFLSMILPRKESI